MELSQEKLDQLFAQVKHNRDRAEADRAAFIARQNKAYLYWAAKLPGPTFSEEKNDKGEYVEPVLFNAVKEALPQLLDSFTADKRLSVVFRSRAAFADQERDDLITDNINRQFLDRQDGYAYLEKMIKETCIVGSSFGINYVSRKSHHQKAKLPDWIDVLDFGSGLRTGWGINFPDAFNTDKSGKSKGFEWKVKKTEQTDPQSGQKQEVKQILIRGTIPLIRNEKYYPAEHVEARDLWFDTSCGDKFEDLRYGCRRIETTIGEAELRGFKLEDLKEATFTHDDHEVESVLEQPTYSQRLTNDENSSPDEKERKIHYYESYMFSSIPDEETRLYQVVDNGKKVMSYTEIPHMPFIHSRCEIVPGEFFGRGFFDIARQFQDDLSMKARIITQIGKISAWPNFLAVKGQYNRDHLLKVRLPGAIVEQAAPGAIQRFEAQTLDPNFINAYEIVKETEQNTLRRGFGSADLKEMNQFSGATISMSLYNDAQRGMLLSKTIGRTLVEPSLTMLYDNIRYEGDPLIDENGQPQEIELPEHYDLTCDIFTSADDAAQVMDLQQMASFGAQISQMPSEVINKQNVYEMLNFWCKRTDLPASKFITDPSKNVDQEAIEKAQQLQDAQHESALVDLEIKKVQAWKESTETVKLENEIYDSILKNANDREITQQDLFNRIAETKARALIDNDKNSIKSDEVQVKNRQVTNDTLLGVAKHQVEINHNRVNGVM